MAFKEIIFRVEESPDGSYTAAAVGYPIAIGAATWKELHQTVRDAVACHFDPEEKPKLINLHFVRDEVITV